MRRYQSEYDTARSASESLKVQNKNPPSTSLVYITLVVKGPEVSLVEKMRVTRQSWE